ncbi:MAG: hypothetical protein QS748_01370 [Candidatus Endonucleobacter bathymodioli]|uniref:Uncharacterized protein n=1 Tax=Candidatus Endonucleibacter bathymodioli TaxID=539814 RepID=A0AA90NRH1_9GAMM|nr:hypothetical protein [Candidatus Endonucleobacter bathymodioli]
MIKKTNELTPHYKDFININLKQSVESYIADDDERHTKNLHEALHRFSTKLKREGESNKSSKQNKIKQSERGSKFKEKNTELLLMPIKYWEIL